MKNTLNPCKCGTSEGGAEFSSQVTYDGLAVDCIPGLVGKNLSQVIKALGDYVCNIEGRTQILTVSAGAPTGGGEGDIWIRQQGSAITFYQNVGSTWVQRGQLFISGPNITSDLSLPTSNTLSYLNATYPDAGDGDVVFREFPSGEVLWCRYLGSGKWTKEQKLLAE